MAVDANRLARIGIGLGVLTTGLAGMAALIVASYGGSPAQQAWALRLGLTLSLLLSGVAQALVLLGSWLFWRAIRGRP